MLGVFCAASPVAAQQPGPGIACRVSDYNMGLDLVIPLTREGAGNAAGPMQGQLDIHHQKVPRERRSWTLDKRPPTQFWNIGLDTKIRVRIASGEEFVDLVIEVQGQPGMVEERAGNFRLETSEGVRVKGRITCSVG